LKQVRSYIQNMQ